MFLNPQTLLDTQVIIPPSNINLSSFVQQNGIDLDCDQLFDLNFNTTPVMSEGYSIKGEQSLIKPVDTFFDDRFPKGTTGWLLRKGQTYSFESSFGVKIPKDMCGWVIGRSSFNRQGILIRSSLYDQGFESPTIGGTIYCFNNVVIAKGTRIGQIVLSSADGASLYAGQYGTQNNKS